MELFFSEIVIFFTANKDNRIFINSIKGVNSLDRVYKNSIIYIRSKNRFKAQKTDRYRFNI